MKKMVFAVLAVVLLFAGAGEALAQSCNAGPTGPHCLWIGCHWDYTKPTSCYSTGGNLSAGQVCYNEPGWSFGYGASSYADLTFEVTEGHDTAEAFSEVYFDDPTNDQGNAIFLTAFVDHPNTSNDNFYTLASHGGTDGDLLNCPRFGGTFPASVGDIVTVSISVGKTSTNATITAERPIILTY
jgi:hypothetical protein